MDWARRVAGGGCWSQDGWVESAVPAPGATDVALRPAIPADSEFCHRLHQAAMGAYITALFGWDEQVQRDYQDRAQRLGLRETAVHGEGSIKITMRSAPPQG
jgi:hypothetical protein